MFEPLIRGRKVLCVGKGNVPDYHNGTKVKFHFKTTALYLNSTDDSIVDKEILVDNSKKSNKPMELYIGKQFKFPLWEEWVKHMRVNEVSQITLDWKLCEMYPMLSKSYRNFSEPHKGDPDSEEARLKRSNHCCGLSNKTGYGYKDLDELVNTPPSSLQFTIELVQVESPEEVDKEVWLMNEAEMNENVPILRQKGNEQFAMKHYDSAAESYRKALAILEQLLMREKPGDQEWIDVDRKKIPLLLNLSQCELFLGEYYAVIEHTSEVIQKDVQNVKAFFRRAKAHSVVWNVNEARKDFATVMKLDPNLIPAVKEQLQKLDNQVREKNKQDTELLKGKLFA